jgi:hypothetical protein
MCHISGLINPSNYADILSQKVCVCVLVCLCACVCLCSCSCVGMCACVFSEGEGGTGLLDINDVSFIGIAQLCSGCCKEGGEVKRGREQSARNQAGRVCVNIITSLSARMIENKVMLGQSVLYTSPATTCTGGYYTCSNCIIVV